MNGIHNGLNRLLKKYAEAIQGSKRKRIHG